MIYRITGLDLAAFANIAGSKDVDLSDPDIAFINAHNAARGCFAAKVERA